MEPANLIRWSGLAAVLAGVLLLVSEALELFLLDFEDFSTIAATNIYAFVIGGFLLTALLSLLGLVGLYASQAKAAGLLGLLGFLMAFAGTVLVAGAFWGQEFFAPAVAEVAPNFLDAQLPGWLYFGFIVSFFLFAAGWLLFGLATLSAGVYPRWAAVLLIIGAVLVVLPLPLPAPSIVFDVAVVWLGFILLSGNAHQTSDPIVEPGEVVEGGRDTPRSVWWRSGT